MPERLAIPSLSIGAISVQSGVVLAGTGDPNDASDSFYGSGLLRSADGGLTWTLIQNSQDGVAGNHSFSGLGFAGFAWSSATAGTVVAAVSQAAEGVLVNCSGRDQQRYGTLLLDGCRRYVAYVHDHGRQPDCADSATIRRRPWWKGCDRGRLESCSSALLRRDSVSRLLRIGRWRDVDSSGASAWDRVDHDCLPHRTRHDRQCILPDVSRSACSSGDDGRYLCADGGQQ